MKDVFLELNLEIDAGNKKEIDRAIHELVGVEYKDCSQAWKNLKPILKSEDKSPRKDFILRLSQKLK